jgi:MinD-like ATPase involved in chromosome partitioning or flagellar assembly
VADRSDPERAETEEHGILDEERVDTSGIFLGGSTAQVDVTLPVPADDDDAIDEDFDETTGRGRIAADLGAPVHTDTAEAEIIEDVDDTAVHTTDIDDTDTHDTDTHDADIEDAVEDALEDAVAAHESEPAAPASRIAVPVAQPVRAVEPSPVAFDVTLASKRLGELEVSREGADVLTADRLLDPHYVAKAEPEGFWQSALYRASGTLINVGDSKKARERKELSKRIAAPLPGGARFVPVLSRKGGVGKTTVTTLLGMALADARDDRVVAVDANPDRGTLAERIARTSGKTIRDLVRIKDEVVGYNDLSTIVARDETRLDVLASDADPRVSEAFGDDDYRAAAEVAAHYYSVVLTDTGTGIVHSVMSATLERADSLVVVAGLSIDEARLASETLTWLETNGYGDRVRNAVVVLNTTRPGSPLVRADEVEAHFRTRVRSVIRMPYDSHIASGAAIGFHEIHPATREAARQLAAAVVESLRVPVTV